VPRYGVTMYQLSSPSKMPVSFCPSYYPFKRGMLISPRYIVDQRGQALHLHVRLVPSRVFILLITSSVRTSSCEVVIVDEAPSSDCIPLNQYIKHCSRWSCCQPDSRSDCRAHHSCGQGQGGVQSTYGSIMESRTLSSPPGSSNRSW
jgi:hypothetical protein